MMLTPKQLEIVNALVCAASGEDMEAWLSERDISDAEFHAAMTAFDQQARAQGLYYTQ